MEKAKTVYIEIREQKRITNEVNERKEEREKK